MDELCRELSSKVKCDGGMPGLDESDVRLVYYSLDLRAAVRQARMNARWLGLL